MKRYNDYSAYIRRRFGGRVQKISVNAGFTCPNRDGTKGTGGCAFCNNSTFNPDYCDPRRSVGRQRDDGIAFFSPKYQTQNYLAYFQAYSNTYGDTAAVLAKYREALAHPKVCGLVIGTRPDCLADDLLDALADMAREVYVAVELGAESCSDATLSAINRGHTWAETCAAVNRLAERRIAVGLHMIMGLPGESREFMLSEADTLSALPVDFLKLHQLQIVRGSLFAGRYASSPESFDLWRPDDYAAFCVDFAERLNPRIIIERFVSQAPRGMVLAPQWDIKNFEFTHLVDSLFLRRDTWQGRALGFGLDSLPA